MDNFKAGEIEVKYVYKTKPSELYNITASSNAYEYLIKIWNQNNIDKKEEFIILATNRANKVIGWNKISIGSSTATIVDPKEIIQILLNLNACGVVLCHNHPSGNLRPSREDIQITNKINECCKLFDIALLDHLIITSESYYSLKDNGDF